MSFYLPFFNRGTTPSINISMKINIYLIDKKLKQISSRNKSLHVLNFLRQVMCFTLWSLPRQRQMWYNWGQNNHCVFVSVYDNGFPSKHPQWQAKICIGLVCKYQLLVGFIKRMKQCCSQKYIYLMNFTHAKGVVRLMK